MLAGADSVLGVRGCDGSAKKEIIELLPWWPAGAKGIRLRQFVYAFDNSPSIDYDAIMRRTVTTGPSRRGGHDDPGSDVLVARSSCEIPVVKELKRENGVQVYEAAVKETDRGNFDAALSRCREAVALLTGTGHEEMDRMLVDSVLLLSDLNYCTMGDNSRMGQILEEARKVATVSGDRRRLAMVYLHMGRSEMYLHMSAEASADLRRGFDLVEDLADQDMMSRAEPFYAAHYYLRGLLREAAEYSEKALANAPPKAPYILDYQLPVILSMSSAFLGRFPLAIGVMDSHWRRAVLKKNLRVANYYGVILGQVLSMNGQRQAAIEHLRVFQKDTIGREDRFSLVWGRRALAYCLFLEGRFLESYEGIKECLRLSRSMGLRRPFYAMPGVLEMLAHFKRSGYELIPDYDFGAETEYALKGPNILLRGTALRIRAMEMQDKGESPSEVEMLLDRSHSDLIRTGSIQDIAKTRVELALLHLRKGDNDAAKELALNSWEALARSGLHYFPKELRSLTGGPESVHGLTSEPEDVLERYLEMLESLAPSADLDEMLYLMLTKSCRFFNAERGGFFERAGAGRVVLRKGHNLTMELVGTLEFRAGLETVRKALRTNETSIVRNSETAAGPASHGVRTLLCIPFHYSEGFSGVFYYDASYSGANFNLFSNSTLERTINSLGTYLGRIWEYCRRSEEMYREALREAALSEEGAEDLLDGFGAAFQNLIVRADRVAQSDASVLILGETGVGKEFLARRIHYGSPRRNSPFIAVNLASVPEGLMESELFGHEKGAFTGADRQKAGRMELANKGTLFIDEVGDIPKSVQVKLLRVLEERSFVKVGGVIERGADFRLIAATNRDLVKEVENGNFREDLYYRLCVIPLIIPPLRERGDDVLRLSEHFLVYYAKKYNRRVPFLTGEDVAILKSYHWPGNVRELRNVMERAIIMSTPDSFELRIIPAPRTTPGVDDALARPLSGKPNLDEVQRRYIQQVLNQTGGRISGPAGAAVILGMKRTTLQARLKKLGISVG